MTLRPVLHAQAKKKKKEEAANAKLLEAEKRIKVSLDENQSFYFSKIKTMWCYTSINYILKKSSPQNNYLKKMFSSDTTCVQCVLLLYVYCMYMFFLNFIIQALCDISSSLSKHQIRNADYCIIPVYSFAESEWSSQSYFVLLMLMFQFVSQMWFST